MDSLLRNLYRATYRVISNYPNARIQQEHLSTLRDSFKQSTTYNPQKAYVGYLLALETYFLQRQIYLKHGLKIRKSKSKWVERLY
jgi:hypothetical protein